MWRFFVKSSGYFFNVLQADATLRLFCEYLLPADVFTVQNINTAKYKFTVIYATGLIKV